ncbi:hypothetical protein PFAG_01485 [Plasmodium falciparum Santa Lucia]|uniref:Uncharacterized protein n=11 Tax=Plasmodium falciparum TaxID=5833 RepID=C6KT90_PLAF7|nr:conserved Plasmodium protein, unknown function [Plasmodium falciparum 3D7]ETW28540.1 hypothetical protein PFFCH_03911 [Plasmodium falciparum FCH/4]ETW44032.1 hypothetical protein PFNF135_01632 [Plasmodium falciparum NF135/5.C10]ETW50378.1 hypothetical protein PFMALIP_01544 [Plasmodium falciparum MaliPS096_E11]ETW53083.1 hypothetical protein PFUGPA_04709 [Plasmodium falciparum Palo Alto/Uganda]ETW62589.1 hypothetical protein PFMC_01531 [Plasmodium falciparum CAMP/Malaysia]EUT89332.1 hypothe|eukprot:XP_966237.1 conserved Plasmodium protein, unknown function [Plasmodium falciparum 3D7]
MKFFVLFLLVTLNLFHISLEHNVEEEKCDYMNIFTKPLFYNCYVFKDHGNKIQQGCCKYYKAVRKGYERKSEELYKLSEEEYNKQYGNIKTDLNKNDLYSINDIIKNSISEKDMDEIKHLFPVIGEKLLNMNGQDGNINIKRSITDIDDLLVEFNNKHFNLKDIQVKILNGSTKNYDAYFNHIKADQNFIKKKEEILQKSPFYNKTCFKSLGGKNCNNGNFNHNNNNKAHEDDDNDDEDLNYELYEQYKEDDNLNSPSNNMNNIPNGNVNNNDNTINNIHNNSTNNDTYNNSVTYNHPQYTELEEDNINNKSSYYSFTQNFSIVNLFSQNPRKVMQKYLEFKHHLSSPSKEKMNGFLDREYYNTTKKLNEVLEDDLKKTGETIDQKGKKGFVSSFFDDLMSLIYFPKKNVEL